MYARDDARRRRSASASCASSRDSPELAMIVRPDMLNGHEICHGGFIFTLADSAFAFACNSYNLNTVASGCAIEFIGAGARGRRADGDGARTSARRAHRRLRRRSRRTSAARPIALFRGKSYRIKGHLIDEPDSRSVATRRHREEASACPSSSRARRARADRDARAATSSPRCSSSGCKWSLAHAYDTRAALSARSSTPRASRPGDVKSLADLAKFPFTTEAGPARQLSVRDVRRAARAGRRASTRRRGRPASRRSSATRRRTSTRGRR